MILKLKKFLNQQKMKKKINEITNQSLNNGKNKIEIRDDFSSYEDLKTNLESNVCTSRMEYVQKKSLTDLIDFD